MSTVPAEPLIQLQGASRIFLADDVETHALAQVDLVITAGEYVTVAGPSGCGKSTLLSILGLLDTLTAGHYSLAGVAVDGLSLRERARLRNTAIGMVFQSFHLISEMTVLENVELPLTYRDLSSRQRREMAAAALERVGMSYRAKHFPAQLSGGQQQRVAVARAIVGSPSIMLADEPTGNLDSSNGTVVMDLLEDLNAAGTTLCLVTHDPRYAARSHRTVWMFDGRIQEGPPNQRQHPTTQHPTIA